MLNLARECLPQEPSRASLTGEDAAEERARAVAPSRYNIRWGSGGMNISAGLRGEYVDNVFLTEGQEQDDFILSPQVDVGAFFPVGRLNTLSFDVGLAYYHYFKNSELNTGTPLVNPNSELVFNIYSGDFAFRLTEAFSYQETPFHEYGGQFYNVYDTGRFARFDNRVGGTVTWDLKDLVITGAYHHENFFANGSQYNYIDRASELFSARAMLTVMPAVSVGLEGQGSVNRYENEPLNDHWRTAVGPAAELRVSQYIKARLGGGYQHIEYDSGQAEEFNLDGVDTFYAYAGVDHAINKYVSHTLAVSHDNQIGINAPNLEGTHVTYSVTWKANDNLTVSPHAGYHVYEESYGAGDGLYDESFDYVSAGIRGDYRLAENWEASLSYDYRLKDSEFAAYGYTQNRVALVVTYHF